MGLTVKNKTTVALLKLYSEVMRELRDRKVITTWNNPVGDLTVRLVEEVLGLTQRQTVKKVSMPWILKG